MKYSFAAALFAAVAYAADSTSTASAADSVITTAPTHSPSAQEICLAKCSADDSDCRARCGSAPFPKSIQLVDLDKCISTDCIPKQTIAANNYQAYGDCRESCIARYYYNAKNTDGIPDVINTAGGAAATTGSSSGSGSGSGSNSGSGSGSGSTESGSTGTATGTAAKASGSGSAGNKLTFSMGGLVGAIGLAAIVL